jgi:predicted ATP-grasp superfamily ATP-dependent carboligase
LAAALAREGLKYPGIRRENALLSGGGWLRKPFASAGGCGISEHHAARAGQGDGPDSEVGSSDADRGARRQPLSADRPTRHTHYLQERLQGDSCGAVYVAARRRAALLGVTRQLAGCAWAGTSQFAYVGSLGPVTLTPKQSREFHRIGNCLAREFGMKGLFGVDAMLDVQGVWTIEVNPRYSASVEILERAVGLSSIAAHVAACREGRLPDVAAGTHPGTHWGKAILYARRRVRILAAFEQLASRAQAETHWPLMADIPQAGQTLEAGRAITTVFASGACLAEVERGLRARANEVYAALGEGGEGSSQDPR